MRKATVLPLLTIAAALLAGCGSASIPGSRSPSVPTSTSASGAASASRSTSTSTSSSASGVNPNAPESLPPGDIPDTTAYVAYAVPGAGYTVSTPEGWARTSAGAAVSFTDKLNAVRISAAPAHGPVTVASVRRSVLPRLAASVKGYKLQSVSSVRRTAGPAVRTVYLGYSARDPVTNKFGVLAFERYDFLHHGRVVTLLLSSPIGSDNVDPWKKVTDSLVFTR
jgi:hypothetical protein